MPTAPFCTSGTGTGESGTGTTVPQIFFCLFVFLYFCKFGTVVPIHKYILFECPPSRIPLNAHFSPCSYSAQIDCVHGATIVLPSLDTFTLTMGSTVFLVIMVPRVRTELATQGSRWVQGVRQNDFTKCNTEIRASNHFPVMHGVPQRM